MDESVIVALGSITVALRISITAEAAGVRRADITPNHLYIKSCEKAMNEMK